MLYDIRTDIVYIWKESWKFVNFNIESNSLAISCKQIYTSDDFFGYMTDVQSVGFNT